MEEALPENNYVEIFSDCCHSYVDQSLKDIWIRKLMFSFVQEIEL